MQDLIKSTECHPLFVPSPLRNGLINKKNRRHTNENPNQHQKHQAAAKKKHPAETYSSSQISIDVTELHFDINGRLELTCMSTIPASVGVNEQYADFKTTSVKSECSRCCSSNLHTDKPHEALLIYFSFPPFSLSSLSSNLVDVEPAEPTTQLPQSAGMAALGNKSNKVFSLRYPLELLIQCLPMIIIALVNP